ncbi:hypothetical protein CFS9_26670 [Flavobacterium sp. CFS9]|uniref:Uncharacterized protein n=1 Tax=Flavobacterium sp. CFS9 TaxID=3143118 RepID=A0AAT9H3H4_9FLAO
MYHNILTQKDQPEYRAVKKIVKLLLEFVEIDSIYFSKSDEESNLGILTVIISKKSPQYYDEIREHLWKVIKNHNEFSFCIFDRDWIKRELKKGNLFFVLYCNQSMLVYSEVNHKLVLDVKEIKLKKLLRKTSERYKMWTSENDIIGRDLKYYQKCENHLMALYVIQQQLRYVFINVSELLTGEWIFSDSIKEQQKHVKMFHNSLGKAFDPERKEEWTVLKKLDRAREAFQWGKEIEPIDAEVVASAFEKLEWMKNEVRTLFQQYAEKTKLIFESYGNR